jgi:hypothetical protein
MDERALVGQNGQAKGMTAMQLVVAPGGVASAGAFFEAGARLLTLLDEVADAPLDWQVAELRTGSAVAVVSAPLADRVVGDVAFRMTASALRAVATGDGGGAAWSPDAVEAARALAEHLQPTGTKVRPSYLRVVDDVRAPVLDEPILGADVIPFDRGLTEELAALRPVIRSMPGAVRGRLLGFNVTRGNRASLRTPGGRVIRATFESGLRERLKDALLHDVELVGTVKQDSDGLVFHIRVTGVEEINVTGTRWIDLLGADPDFTGGAGASEYLRRTRGEA